MGLGIISLGFYPVFYDPLFLEKQSSQVSYAQILQHCQEGEGRGLSLHKSVISKHGNFKVEHFLSCYLVYKLMA